MGLQLSLQPHLIHTHPTLSEIILPATSHGQNLKGKLSQVIGSCCTMVGGLTPEADTCGRWGGKPASQCTVWSPLDLMIPGHCSHPYTQTHTNIWIVPIGWNCLDAPQSPNLLKSVLQYVFIPSGRALFTFPLRTSKLSPRAHI